MGTNRGTNLLLKGFFPFLLGLALVAAGLFTQPANAVTTTTLTVHYKASANNTTTWSLWAWDTGSAAGGSQYLFTSTDSYGQVATIVFDHAVTRVGFLVFTNTTTWIKDIGADRFAAISGSTGAIWLRGGDGNTYGNAANALSQTSPLSTPAAPQGPAGLGSTTSTAVVPTWIKNAVVYEVNVRAFSKEGTFTAFTRQLPRLKTLGVDVLWLMPIHQPGQLMKLGTMGSPYAVKDFRGVNPNYGTLADFKSLVKSAHAFGMKVILDWVGNHTAWDNIWITSHRDWYTQDSSGKILTPIPEWQDLADLNYDNADMRAEMLSAMTMWVKTYGVDGFRADYAGGVPTSFWNTATTALNAIKPIYMVAEDDSKPELMSSSFNSNYGWSLNGFMNAVSANTQTKSGFQYQVDRLNSFYPKNSYPMNFITNHDQNAWNGTEFERMGSAVPAMAVLEFLFPGIPMIYTGQEIGLNRRLSFFDKDQVVWPDDSTWTHFYSKLIDLKTRNSSLWNGQYGGELTMLPNTNSRVVSFARTKGTNKVIGIWNLSNQPQTVTVTTSTSTKSVYMYDFDSYTRLKVLPSTTVTIPAFGYLVYSTALVKAH